MKTTLPFRTSLNYLTLVIVSLLITLAAKAQTYTTIANGAWSSAATWQGGSIPVATNIPAGAVVNIKHIVNYSGGNIVNNGTINVQNPGGVSPRLILASGVSVSNLFGANFVINNGEVRQYRFVGGGESGTLQSGSFINAGGYVGATNSFIEIAGIWENKNAGKRVMRNSSIALAGGYNQNSNAIDTIENSSISCGWDGSSDFTVTGSSIYFQSVRIQVASSGGNFMLTGCTANGDIDCITLKNHVTGITSAGTITVSNSVITSGLNLDAYCAVSAASYLPHGKCIGTQTLNCSLNYFPAVLFGTQAPPKFNLSLAPVLVSGTDLQVNAIYKFESVAPGVDVMVKIDSFVNGASINKIDDNTGGLGYLEGFQPEVKTGPTTGTSYVVFKLDFKVTGTATAYPMNTFNITALDIDGNSSLNEFDQISLGTGAIASYMASPTNIAISNIAPGTFRGLNISNAERSGIDTASIANMFTVTNTNVSSFTLKLGAVKSITSQESRQYGIYFKGFAYPGSVLPVKLASFTATLANNSKVDLKWTTASEINVSHFAVEKSFDGANFSEAGLVFAYGNATENTNYSFSDNLDNNSATVIYYRLRSVDVDGKTEYSETRVIRISKGNESTISILAFPNPAVNDLRITIPAAWQNKAVTYQVYSINGQVVNNKQTSNSSQTETINISTLAPGMYIIKASCGNETAQQRIVKQ